MEVDRVTGEVIGAAIAVHKALGPGLLESTYEACLALELTRRGVGFERQVAMPLTYEGVVIDVAYRADFLVAGRVIVELKAVAAIDPVHVAQLLTYLRISGCTVGLLINFNVPLLKDGIRRLIMSQNRRPHSGPPRLSAPLRCRSSWR